MKTIEFYGQKFYLEKLGYVNGDTKIVISNDTKRSLRYQIVLLAKGEKSSVVSLAGTKSVKVSPDYQEAWIIKKGTKACEELQEYDSSEVMIIRHFIRELADRGLEVTEAMCKNLGDTETIMFYKSYGAAAIKKFRNEILTLPEKTGARTYTSKKAMYGRVRYDILHLLRDLENASGEVKVLTDPDLIGRYKRISRKVKDGSIPLLDQWNLLIGVQGNRTRANLSLLVSAKTKVTIPENEVGVEAGDRVLDAIRSFTIVVDGTLNLEEIGIKTSDTKLIGKLKRIGIVTPLVLTDEWLIDLSGIPVSTSKKSVGSLQLGIAEYMVKRSEIIASYISRLIYKAEKKLAVLPKKPVEEAIDPKSEFLKGLGIYGDKYYAPKTEALEVENSYQTTEVIGEIQGLPKDPAIQIINYINTGTSKNPAILEVLSPLEALRRADLTKLKAERDYYDLDKKVRVQYLRDLKFQVILRKRLRFWGKKEPRVENCVVDMPDKKVKVKWVVKETEIKV